jgi:hypothetical protein
MEAQRVDLGEREQMTDYLKVPAGEPIPLSHLELDLPARSVGGWSHYLAECNIAIVNDDLGRACIARADARRLFEEKRAAEQKAREMAEANEQQAIEADRQWRAGLPKGAAWYDVPPGVLPVVAMTAAAKDALPRRRSVLEDAFAGAETTMYIPEPQPVFEDE